MTAWTRSESDPRYTSAELLGCEMGTAQDDPPGQVGWEVCGGPWGHEDGVAPTEAEAQAAAAGWVRVHAARDLEALGLLLCWIPVASNVFPADGQEILVFVPGEPYEHMIYAAPGGVINPKATHWMPAPLPPQS